MMPTPRKPAKPATPVATKWRWFAIYTNNEEFAGTGTSTLSIAAALEDAAEFVECMANDNEHDIEDYVIAVVPEIEVFVAKKHGITIARKGTN